MVTTNDIPGALTGKFQLDIHDKEKKSLSIYFFAFDSIHSYKSLITSTISGKCSSTLWYLLIS